jgi:hypothetical protein
VDTLAGRTYAGDADNQTHVWYGPQTCTHGQTSPTWGATGPGATTLANQAWLYDPMALVAVAGGTTPSYGIVPRMDFRAMQLGGFCQEQCTRNYQFGQMFWDPPTQRLYVSEVSAYREADPYPVVHVFQVA